MQDGVIKRGYSNNTGRKEGKASISLLQNTNGILAMLDEECLRPGTVTDETFLEKLNQVCATHQHFESRMSKCSRFLNDTSLPHSCFRIQHYAGKVGRGQWLGCPHEGRCVSSVRAWEDELIDKGINSGPGRAESCPEH